MCLGGGYYAYHLIVTFYCMYKPLLPENKTNNVKFDFTRSWHGSVVREPNCYGGGVEFEPRHGYEPCQLRSLG